MLPKDYKCEGQMDIFDYLKSYDVGFLRYHISRMDDSKVAALKGLTRSEFICNAGGKAATIDVGNLVTGQRFFVTDDADYRPDVDHVPWDDYIAMFKEVWGDEEPAPIPELPPDELFYQWSCNYEYYCYQRKHYFWREHEQRIDSITQTMNLFMVSKSEYEGNVDIMDRDCECGLGNCPTYSGCDWRKENYRFSWDDDINEIHHKIIELARKYKIPISEAKWEIWDHVPNLGYRMWITLEVKRCVLTDILYEDLDCIVDFAKEKNIKLSPTAPVFFDLEDDPNEVAPMYISSMFKDKARQKRKKW